LSGKWRKTKAPPQTGASAPVTILTNTGNPVRVPAIALQGMRERQEVRFSDGLYVRSVEEFLALAEKADIIVVSRPSAIPIPDRASAMPCKRPWLRANSSEAWHRLPTDLCSSMKGRTHPRPPLRPRPSVRV
jgi:hypothetical protein